MVSYQEAKALINVDQFWKELEDTVNELRDYFIHHLTLRFELTMKYPKMPVHFIYHTRKKNVCFEALL